MWHVIGHSRVTAALEQALERGRLAGAYLIVGPPSVGKTTLALDLACAINCLAPGPAPCGECPQCRRILAALHPDVALIEVEAGKSVVTVGQIDELLHNLMLRPFEGRCRVAIIPEAGRLSRETPNILLKTLEEPSTETLIILCTAAAEDILPTIRSRCTTITLQPAPISYLTEALVTRYGATEEQAQAAAAFAQGRPGLALRALQQPELMAAVANDLDLLRRALAEGIADRIALTGELATGPANASQREAVLRTLDTWLQWWRDAMLHAGGAAGPYAYPAELPHYRRSAELGITTMRTALGATQTAMRQIEQNATPRLVLDVLLTRYPRLTVMSA